MNAGDGIPTAVDPRGKLNASWAQAKTDRLAPDKTAVLPNYPNPFNPETTIPFDLAEDAQVSIAIYDATGRVVRALNMGDRQAGFYRTPQRAAHWDGRSDEGEAVGSGTYFAELAAGHDRATRRIVVVK